MPPGPLSQPSSHRRSYDDGLRPQDQSPRARSRACQEIRPESKNGLLNMSSLKLTNSGRVVSDGHSVSESSKGAPKGESSGPSSLGPSSDGFWRSQADLDNTPEFQEFLAREYPEQEEQLKDPLSRRNFVQLMGASFALAGVTQACRWEEEKIMPLSRRPRWIHSRCSEEVRFGL